MKHFDPDLGTHDLVPDPIIHEYRECCRVDAHTQWMHFLSYISGYKNAMLSYSCSPLRTKQVYMLHFLYEVAQHRAAMAEHVFRRN